MHFPVNFSFEKKRHVLLTAEDLVSFENNIKTLYEQGQVKGPIHLSGNNEPELIKLFQYISPTDWVFSAWRNHYHALLHGVNSDKLRDWIIEGRSMGIINSDPNFYTSSIVGGIIPIALGVAQGLKLKNSKDKVWCFIGDMTFETGVFWEAYKYSQNFDLPLQFVVEDNNNSVHTNTESAWGKRCVIPNKVIYYTYEMKYPHHGTGKWVNF